MSAQDHPCVLDDEETLTPQGRLQLPEINIKHRYSCPIYSSDIKVNLKLKRKKINTEASNFCSGKGAHNAAGLKYFGVTTNIALFKSGYIEKKMLHNKINLKISSKRSESLVKTEIKN